MLKIKKIAAILFTICTACIASTGVLDPMQHDIQILTSSNFETMLSKLRKNYVVTVFFYSSNDKDTVSNLLGWYNTAAKELKGIIKVTAINCTEFKKFCEKQGYLDKLIIYPVLPIPSFKYTGDKDEKSFKSQVLRFVPKDKITTLSSVNDKEAKLVKIEEFLTRHISVPKVLIFSEKSTPPVIIHALANEFDKKLLFGFIPNCSTNEDSINISKKYKISKFPHIMVYKNESKKPEVYKGKIEFTSLFEYLNVYAETFVMGGGFSDHDGSQNVLARPWLEQSIPELTGLSYGDICSKHKTFCVIYLKNGELTSDEQTMLEELKELFTPHISGRGTNFRWMWMDISIESEFYKLFKGDNDQIKLPSAVILGTNKRLKFTLLPKDLEGELQTADKNTIKDLLDKVMGGDARFINIPGQKLPTFAKRAANSSRISNDKKDEL
ncbi:hypothetical protein ACR3K2_12120 [Cryptosporidium serpentis]